MDHHGRPVNPHPADIKSQRLLDQIFSVIVVGDCDVNGKTIKMVSLIVRESKVSLFMDKSADSEKVLRKLHEI